MDLRTRYLGLALHCPLVPSASPLAESIDNLKRMEDAGAGAVVLHSLFEEQIEQEARTLDHYLGACGVESFAERSPTSRSRATSCSGRTNTWSTCADAPRRRSPFR